MLNMLFVRQERKKRQALLVGCSLFALFAFFTAHKKSVFICVHLWISTPLRLGASAVNILVKNRE
jgi:hypothetical protein